MREREGGRFRERGVKGRREGREIGLRGRRREEGKWEEGEYIPHNMDIETLRLNLPEKNTCMNF